MPKGVHGNHRRGSSHYRWNGEKMLSSEGYKKIRVGVSHPLADPNGYAYEHLLVWCAAGKPRPENGQLIHHKNEDKLDNRLENLELTTRSEHNAHHNAERGRDSKGRFLPHDGLTDAEYAKAQAIAAQSDPRARKRVD